MYVARAAALLDDLRGLWDAATPQEQTEIVGALFASLKVTGKVVSATVKDEYALLIAISQARMVGMARPEGFEPPTI